MKYTFKFNGSKGRWRYVMGMMILGSVLLIYIIYNNLHDDSYNSFSKFKNIQNLDKSYKESSAKSSKSEITTPIVSTKVSYLDSLCPLPTKTEIENWLSKNGRSAKNLQAAATFAGTYANELLLESLRNNPKDAVSIMRVLQYNLLPEQKAKLFEELEKNDPDNAMPSYLEACRLLADGKIEEAQGKLLSGSKKQIFDSHIETIKADTEMMLRDMGRSEIGASALSSLGIRNSISEEIAIRLSSVQVNEVQPIFVASSIAALEALSENEITASGKLNTILHLHDLINDSKVYAADLASYLDRPFEDYAKSVNDQTQMTSHYIKFVADPGKFLSGLPASTQADFFRRTSKFGETAAVDWLFSKQ